MTHENPYASPSLAPHTRFVANPYVARPSVTILAGYLGTTLSGGLFGILAGPIGFLYGTILAGIAGLFVFAFALLIAVGKNGIRTRNGLRLLGGFSGGLTGMLSTWALTGFETPATLGWDFIAFAGSAGVIGFLGGALGAAGKPGPANASRNELS